MTGSRGKSARATTRGTSRDLPVSILGITIQIRDDLCLKLDGLLIRTDITIEIVRKIA